jgi:hypothetical protein
MKSVVKRGRFVQSSLILRQCTAFNRRISRLVKKSGIVYTYDMDGNPISGKDYAVKPNTGTTDGTA